MGRRFYLGASALGLAAGVLILTSCSTPQTRISDHPDLYQRLSRGDQALVSQGQVRYGMSRNAVWLAWGSPDQKIVGNMEGHPTETWIYIYYATYPYYPYYGSGSWGPWASNDSAPSYSLGYTSVAAAGVRAGDGVAGEICITTAAGRSCFSAALSTTRSIGRTSRRVSLILAK